MANEPAPQTVEQLQAEIAKLKGALDGSLPKAEADKVRAELAEARAELTALKAAPPPPPVPPVSKGFFPRLF